MNGLLILHADPSICDLVGVETGILHRSLSTYDSAHELADGLEGTEGAAESKAMISLKSFSARIYCCMLAES